MSLGRIELGIKICVTLRHLFQLFRTIHFVRVRQSWINGLTCLCEVESYVWHWIGCQRLHILLVQFVIQKLIADFFVQFIDCEEDVDSHRELCMIEKRGELLNYDVFEPLLIQELRFNCDHTMHSFHPNLMHRILQVRFEDWFDLFFEQLFCDEFQK